MGFAEGPANAGPFCFSGSGTGRRAPIPPAARNARDAYDRTNLRMLFAIVATRKAFERLGVGNICNFAI